MTTEQMLADLRKWSSPLFDRGKRYGLNPFEDHVYVDLAERHLRMRLFTDNNQYEIYARCREDGSAYLGAGCSSRKPRAGESWSRGHDLPDGEFSFETWTTIIYAILASEMVKLHCSVNKAIKEMNAARRARSCGDVPPSAGTPEAE